MKKFILISIFYLVLNTSLQSIGPAAIVGLENNYKPIINISLLYYPDSKQDRIECNALVDNREIKFTHNDENSIVYIDINPYSAILQTQLNILSKNKNISNAFNNIFEKNRRQVTDQIIQGLINRKSKINVQLQIMSTINKFRWLFFASIFFCGGFLFSKLLKNHFPFNPLATLAKYFSMKS
ncbi:MAG: hypothetical protein WDZ41_04605 [Candidatus Babeliales bacterium]